VDSLNLNNINMKTYKTRKDNEIRFELEIKTDDRYSMLEISGYPVKEIKRANYVSYF
jgi:hypothetical protein